MNSIIKLGIICAVFVVAGCNGGGRWVDAPQVCMGGWGILQFANIGEETKRLMEGTPAAEPGSKDLKKAFDQMISKEKKKGASEKDIKDAREALESTIAMGAKSVCGGAGMSFTGVWECSETQQRVKCK